MRGEHGDPFAILGPHRLADGPAEGLAVRAFLPGASGATVVPPEGGPAAPAPQAMVRLHPEGFFQAILPDRREPFPYRLRWTNAAGATHEAEDPYRFPSTLSDFDLHLLGEGAHYRAYEKLGAHPAALDGVTGVVFAVWAPNARRVSVVGDFNGWDGRRHPMRLHPGNGLWELFVPGLGEGALYKFEILPSGGGLLTLKADPYALAFEEPPRTASRVADLALKVLSAYGYSGEYPVERYFRDAKLYQLLEGTANIHKTIIAGDALGYRKANR